MSMSTKNAEAYAALDATKGMTVQIVDGRSYGRIKTGNGRAEIGFRVTPAAARALAALPVADRVKALQDADAIRKDAGHPTNADRPTPEAVWDHHVAAAVAGVTSAEDVAAWRRASGVPRPSRA